MHRSFLIATAFALVTSAATAHVSFETAQAPVGSTYKAILRIPPGREGEATDSVRIKIPEGVIAVKPMPKPGWKIEKVVARYTAEYELTARR